MNSKYLMGLNTYEKEEGGVIRHYAWTSYHYKVLFVASILPGPKEQKHERVIERMREQDFLGDWRVYVGDVPGKNHEKEWRDVARSGGKVPERVAKAVFPRIAEAGYKYAR